MEKGAKVARSAINETIRNQIRYNDPPETKQTYDRLLALGKNKDEVMDLIGSVISVEIFEILKNNKPFNRERFVRNLSNLPALPF